MSNLVLGWLFLFSGIYSWAPKSVPDWIPEDFFPAFSQGIFHRNVILEGVAGIPVFFALQEFFAGIPAGQEFLYLLRIPHESGGFRSIPVPAKSCWLWPATKEGSLLSKIWTKIDLFNLSLPNRT
jgi:hypothetical protein